MHSAVCVGGRDGGADRVGRPDGVEPVLCGAVGQGTECGQQVPRGIVGAVPRQAEPLKVVAVGKIVNSYTHTLQMYIYTAAQQQQLPGGTLSW